MRVWPVTTLALLTLLSCTSYAADDAPKPDAPKPDTTKPDTGKDKEKAGKGGKHAPGGDIAAIYKLALQHAAEINLTDEQKEKLLKLKAVVDEQNEKLKNDPELTALHAQMKEARKNDDKDKAKELNKQIRELTDKKSGDALQTALKDAEGVLTAEQTAKIKDIQKQEREKKTADKTEKAAAKDNAAAPATPPATEKAPEAKPAEAPKTAEAPKPADPAPADNGMQK